MSADASGYVDYYELLGLEHDAKPGEVRKVYRRRMKDLVGEIAQAQLTEELRTRYLLDMAKLNAALYLLRDLDAREVYWKERSRLIELERAWCEADAAGQPEAANLRKQFESKVRDFLSKYVEELMLTAGRDKEAVEASNWDEAHERHAFRILRHFRQGLLQEILERLPFVEVTKPEIDWAERERTVMHLLREARTQS